MDVLKLFMAIPDKINFLQMGDTESSPNRRTATIS